MNTKVAIIIIISIFLIGCAGSRAWQGAKIGSTAGEAKINNEKIMKLEIGQTKQDVLKIMGPPTKREAYELENKKIIEFFFYRTQGWSVQDGGDKDYQFTPFALENDRLTGWGRNFYDNVVRSAVEIIIKK